MTNIPFIDVETDGLIGHTGHLLEIAVVVTDADLNELGEYHAIVRYEKSEVTDLINSASPHVRVMHTTTGLWAKLPGGTPLSDIDVQLVSFLSHFGAAGEMPIGGNSVSLDKEFIREHLPLTSGYLDYHMRDVSTVAGLASDWYNLPWFEKHSDHTAMTDVRESIRELKHYREAIFKEVSET